MVKSEQWETSASLSQRLLVKTMGEAFGRNKNLQRSTSFRASRRYNNELRRDNYNPSRRLGRRLSVRELYHSIPLSFSLSPLGLLNSSVVPFVSSRLFSFPLARNFAESREIDHRMAYIRRNQSCEVGRREAGDVKRKKNFKKKEWGNEWIVLPSFFRLCRLFFHLPTSVAGRLSPLLFEFSFNWSLYLCIDTIFALFC